MKMFELATVLFVIFAGYSVVKDIFTPDPPLTCYRQVVLEDGSTVGSWSEENCKFINSEEE